MYVFYLSHTGSKRFVYNRLLNRTSSAVSTYMRAVYAFRKNQRHRLPNMRSARTPPRCLLSSRFRNNEYTGPD